MPNLRKKAFIKGQLALQQLLPRCEKLMTSIVLQQMKNCIIIWLIYNDTKYYTMNKVRVAATELQQLLKQNTIFGEATAQTLCSSKVKWQKTVGGRGGTCPIAGDANERQLQVSIRLAVLFLGYHFTQSKVIMVARWNMADHYIYGRPM